MGSQVAHLQRRDCSITLDWQPLVRVEVTSAKSTPKASLERCRRTSFKVDKDKIAEQFGKAAGGPPSVQRSV